MIRRVARHTSELKTKPEKERMNVLGVSPAIYVSGVESNPSIAMSAITALMT